MKKRNIKKIKDVKITPARHRVISGSILHKQRKGLGDFIGMPQNTVNSHLKTLFLSFHIHTLSELIVLALSNGYDVKGKWHAPALIA